MCIASFDLLFYNPIVDRIEPFDARVERRNVENRKLAQICRLDVT